MGRAHRAGGGRGRSARGDRSGPCARGRDRGWSGPAGAAGDQGAVGVWTAARGHAPRLPRGSVGSQGPAAAADQGRPGRRRLSPRGAARRRMRATEVAWADRALRRTGVQGHGEVEEGGRESRRQEGSREEAEGEGCTEGQGEGRREEGQGEGGREEGGGEARCGEEGQAEGGRQEGGRHEGREEADRCEEGDAESTGVEGCR